MTVRGAPRERDVEQRGAGTLHADAESALCVERCFWSRCEKIAFQENATVLLESFRYIAHHFGDDQIDLAIIVVTPVAGIVAVKIALGSIGEGRAVVVGIANPVAVTITAAARNANTELAGVGEGAGDTVVTLGIYDASEHASD